MSAAQVASRDAERQRVWNTIPFVEIANYNFASVFASSILRKVVNDEDFQRIDDHSYAPCSICKKQLKPFDDPKTFTSFVRIYHRPSFRRPPGIEKHMGVIRLPCHHYFHIKYIAATCTCDILEQ